MDGTDTNQDTKQAESPVTPSGTMTGTPTVTTFTQEQVDKIINDRLAQAGREAKAIERMKLDIEKREKAIRDAEYKRQKDEEEREIAELTAVTKDRPEELPNLRSFKERLAAQKRAVMEKEADLLKKEAEFTEKFKKTEQTEFEFSVLQIANKYGVDVDVLKNQAMELGIKDKVEDLAKLLPKKVVVTPDSGKTRGGSSMTKTEAYAKYAAGEITTAEFRKLTQT